MDKKFLKYKYRDTDSFIDDVKKDNVIIEAKQSDTMENCNEIDDDFDNDIVNIDNVDELALIIKSILELSWGKDWGELVPEYIEDETNPIFPKIVYDINTRELSEHNSKKPIFYGTTKEIVDGKETGDGFNVYRQWYDTVIEFNFYHHTIKEARKLMLEFEKVINTYIGLIKSKGLSEMMYLEEIPTEKSMKYKPGVPMKAIAYYVRFESIHKVRTSLLKHIELIIKSSNEHHATY